MLPLASAAFPDSSDGLRQALQEGLREYGVSAREITVQSSAFPQIELLQIELSSAAIDRKRAIPKAKPSGSGEIRVSRFEIQGRPLLVEGSPVQLDLGARDAVFHEARGSKGESILLLQTAADGHVRVDIASTDLDRLIQKLASEAAAQQGAEILETHLTLTSKGPKSLAVEGKVVAKMFFKVELSFTGNLDLDDQLNLRFSNLTTSGSGMAAGLAANFLRPHFAKLQEKPIPLTAFNLGGLRPSSAEISTGEVISFHAKFGSDGESKK